MQQFFYTNLEFLLRLVIAGVCGALIGYERKNRLKEAGVRTHLIVCLASALMMIVSKYGFSDVAGQNGIGVDPSRIAAQIVSGVGFLGAGIIFIRKQAISGLTTAAGIWGTAGVGMAVGSGLYFIGIAAVVLIILVQIVLHRNIRWLKVPVVEQVTIQMEDKDGAIAFLQKRFETQDIEILNVKAKKSGKGLLNVELFVKLPDAYHVADLLNLFAENPHIQSVEI